MSFFNLPRVALAFIALPILVAADSLPFTITCSSSNTTLDGTRGVLTTFDTYVWLLTFTNDPTLAPTVYTLDNAGGHFVPNVTTTLNNGALREPIILWGGVDTSNSYDAKFLFYESDVEDSLNWALCHQYTNYISCAASSENLTRLSKFYVCPLSDFGTASDTALKIGNAVPTGCSGVQLNFTNVA